MFCSEQTTLHDLFGNTIKKANESLMRLVLNDTVLASSSSVLFTILHHLPQAVSLRFFLFFLLGTQLNQKLMLSLGFFASLSFFLHWSFGAFCSIFCAHLFKIWVSWTAKLLVSMYYFWHGYAHMHSRLDDLWLY